MGTLTLRITPAGTIPLTGGNLGVVVSNKPEVTLENLCEFFASLKPGAKSLTTGGVPNTTAVRCDVDPVAATGTYTLSSSLRLSMPEPMVALPCGSRSTTSTRWPTRASPAARLTVVVVLPAPPF